MQPSSTQVEDLRALERQMRDVHAHWAAVGRRWRAGMLVLLALDMWLTVACVGASGAPHALIGSAVPLLQGERGTWLVGACWLGTLLLWRSEACQWRARTAAAFTRRSNVILRRFGGLAFEPKSGTLRHADGSRALPSLEGVAGGANDSAACGGWRSGLAVALGRSLAPRRSGDAGGAVCFFSDDGHRGGSGGGSGGSGSSGGGCNGSGGSAGSSVGPREHGRAPERRVPRMRSRTPMRRTPSGWMKKTIVD